jgi:hypothetical protein
MADTIATAADYADAMITARRAKKLLFFLLLLILLAQLIVFGVARFTDVLFVDPAVAATQPATAPAGVAHDVLRYVIGVTVFLGIVLAIVQSIVLLLLLNIMLIGRLIGVARMTSAVVWSLVLLVLLFPWQAFLETYDWKPTGALYTWAELVKDARFPGGLSEHSWLKWWRFVVFPVVALILHLSIRVKSNRGLRQALGEIPPDGRIDE